MIIINIVLKRQISKKLCSLFEELPVLYARDIAKSCWNKKLTIQNEIHIKNYQQVVFRI